MNNSGETVEKFNAEEAEISGGNGDDAAAGLQRIKGQAYVVFRETCRGGS